MAFGAWTVAPGAWAPALSPQRSTAHTNSPLSCFAVFSSAINGRSEARIAAKNGSKSRAVLQWPQKTNLRQGVIGPVCRRTSLFMHVIEALCEERRQRSADKAAWKDKATCANRLKLEIVCIRLIFPLCVGLKKITPALIFFVWFLFCIYEPCLEKCVNPHCVIENP